MRPRRSRDRAWHHPLERVWCISIRSWLLLGSSQLRIRRLRSLWDASFDVPYDDGDDVEDQGDDPHNLSGPVRTLQAEVVARLDGGELYGDALHQEEANQKTGNAKHYTDRRPLSLLASLRGEAVDPLVGLGAGHVLERLAEAILQALDAVLPPPLDGKRLQQVDLALARLACAAPLGGGRLLGLSVWGVLLCCGILGRPWRRVLSPLAEGSRPAARGRARGDGRCFVAIGELFEGGCADVHSVAQGTGFRPGLGHPDQVRGDVAPDVLGAGVPDT